jgi:hypothetical protein
MQLLPKVSIRNLPNSSSEPEAKSDLPPLTESGCRVINCGILDH